MNGSRPRVRVCGFRTRLANGSAERRSRERRSRERRTRLPDQRALLALGAELVQMRRPVRPAGRVRGTAAMPTAHAGDRLLAVLVLVDDVAQRLGLAGAVGGAGQGQWTAVQRMGSWACRAPSGTRYRG